MSLKTSFAKLVDAIVDRVNWRLEAARSNSERDASRLLDWVARCEDIGSFQFPGFYMEFLRDWFEAKTWKVDHVKVRSARSAYASLLDQLVAAVPVPPCALAQEAGRIADQILARREPFQSPTWRADVGLHFEISSSFGEKGRLLCAAVRFLRPQQCLELGTAYGMSSLFIARSQSANGGGSLTTVEIQPQQYEIASAILRDTRLPIECILGSSRDATAALRQQNRRFDFVFHDASHNYESYTGDFEALEPMLGASAVFVLDDIRWSDPRFYAGDPRCYEAWRKITEHPRVVAAAEINGSVGIALLS